MFIVILLCFVGIIIVGGYFGFKQLQKLLENMKILHHRQSQVVEAEALARERAQQKERPEKRKRRRPPKVAEKRETNEGKELSESEGGGSEVSSTYELGEVPTKKKEA